VPAVFVDVCAVQTKAALGRAIASVNALMKAVAHELRPKFGIDDQLGLIVVERLAIVAQQALGKILHYDRAAKAASRGDRLFEIWQHIDMRGDQTLLVRFAHGPVGPELHLRQSPQMAEPLDHPWQLLMAAFGDDRVREARNMGERLEVLESTNGFVE